MTGTSLLRLRDLLNYVLQGKLLPQLKLQQDKNIRSEERRVGKDRRSTRSKRDWSSDVCSSDLNFVRAKARTYFLIGADREDIIQEGMIGLYKAIRDYDGDKLASFKGFAELCITRQIITAIKTATRQKH